MEFTLSHIYNQLLYILIIKKPKKTPKETLKDNSITLPQKKNQNKNHTRGSTISYGQIFPRFWNLIHSCSTHD